MKRHLLKRVYFNNADDRNLERFTLRFLSSGLLWVYIALNPEKNGVIYLQDLIKKINLYLSRNTIRPFSSPEHIKN